MKEHIIRANLYQNGQVEWEDAEHSTHFNVHQKTRQFLEVKLKDFLLGDGESLLAAFEKVEDGETNHENPDLMHKVADAENGAFYRIQIPSLVHNTPGAWNVQFSLATDYDKLTGDYTACYPSWIAQFTEYSSIMDDGLTVPSVGELKEMCDRYADVAEELKIVDQSAKNAEAAACSAGVSAKEAQAYAKQLENSVEEAYQRLELKVNERYVKISSTYIEPSLFKRYLVR